MSNLLFENKWTEPNQDVIISKLNNLIKLHKQGILGGEIMPEDANPGLPLDCKDNFHFFTLPMALNYQRNSYKLWPAATRTYNNPENKALFDPKEVSKMPTEKLREQLVRNKIALQPNKHVEIWQKICITLTDYFDGDIRNLFIETDGRVGLIKEIVQVKRKKGFPYLSGEKICNYWLYVMEQYTSTLLKERERINVAPDTHVIQSSFKLGLINPEYRDKPNVRNMISDKWTEVLNGSDLLPIDIHTPLWLWSRSGFTLVESL
ncbi:MAG: hypothetical protein GY834_07010 [Bacteroidetes bacterium]|nr:hypothetical protein [Bacteroidota bacterium]